MTTTRQPIRAVIWDLGGVLVRTEDWAPRRRWGERLGLEPGDLSRLLFEGEVGRRATLGQASADDVWRWVGEQLGLTGAEVERLRRDFWAGDRVDESLVDYIRDLRPAYRTALLSNAWPDLRHFVEKVWCIGDAFDVIVISAEVGMAKPHPRIYRLVLERLGMAPEETVFIDDFPVNVEAARQVGLHAIHFRGPEQALQELEVLVDRRL